MRRLLVIIALVGCAASCSERPDDSQALRTKDVSTVSTNRNEAVATETERLYQWLDERFEEWLSRWPMWMTDLGRKDKYAQIDDFSEAAEEQALQWRAATVTELTSQFDYEALSDDAKVSYDLWIYQYEIHKTMAAFRRNEYVFSQMYGAQAELPAFLINKHRVDDVADMRAYITRIEGISRALDQLLERASIAAADGVRPPRFTYRYVLDEARNQINGAPFNDTGEDSPLWADAQAKVEELEIAGQIDRTAATKLTEAARAALLNSFYPAYARLISWFESDIENSDVNAKGVGSLPKGADYYNACLRYRTTLPITAEELHQTGLQEVARLRSEMETIKRVVGFDGSLEDFFQFVKTNPQFYYSNDEEGRQRYLEETKSHLNKINRRLPEYFGLLPKAELLVKRVESYREVAGAAPFYARGTPDGSRPGVYYLHLSDMSALPTTEMEATAYHEGNPGHHMQLSITQELTNIPAFRTQAWFNSYSEGWALYSELLAKEMGAYEDPYSDFGRLTNEMMRAIRLVVDTGIHAMGWTEQQAIAYFADNSATSDKFIESEIHRYFVWPGQATSYKVGMQAIQDLRKKSEEALDEKFDIREFHDTILGAGAVPLSILERVVDNWIDETIRGRP